MKAEKVIVTIKFNLLSIDSVPAMISRIKQLQISDGVEDGSLRMSDSDEITWNTQKLPVEL